MGKLKNYLMEMKENEMSEIGIYWNGEGNIILECEGNQLIMTRTEAEILFVDIGHILQELDIDKYDENGELKPCPTM